MIFTVTYGIYYVCFIDLDFALAARAMAEATMQSIIQEKYEYL